MPWPAPDLPINFQNATVSLDTHPQAHNATNLSLNNDYRPELSRVGSSLAATQSVYQGVTPTGTAIIRADNAISLQTNLGNIIRRNSAGDNQGSIPAFVTAARTSSSESGFTTGATPVTAYTLAITGTFPRGGFIQARYLARFAYNTSNGIGYCYPGWNTGGGVQFSSGLYAMGAVVVSGVNEWVTSSYTITIPVGAVNPQIVLGVADANNVGGVEVVSGSIQGDVWTY